MKPLAGTTFIALGTMAKGALARYLESLGAERQPGLGQLASADFLIEDLGSEGLAAQGLNRDRIAVEHPHLVHVTVTPFGSDGPLSGWQAGELVASAMGGVLRLTGEPDRRPVKEALDACIFHAEMVAAAGAMAAHFSRGRSGRGQHVDVSVQEVAFSRNVSGVLSWQFDRRKLHRVGGALNYGIATVRCIWKLADGWCFHSLMTGRFGAPANQALSDWIDEKGLPNPLQGVDWLTYNRSTLPAETRAVWEAALTTFFASVTKAEIREEGRSRGINACAVAEPLDVLTDPHLQARGFWNEGDGMKAPSRFVGIKAGSAGEAAATPAGTRPGPLSGVRVLDFSWALVGSICTKTLGDLGADVIKVESRTRPCLSRIDVQVNASKAGEFDDKPWFAHLNTSKRSLALDLKKPEAWDLLGPLIDWADVVVENFSPGTMEKLGLDFTSLSRLKPGIVMISGSVYGQTGPMAQEWGVDGTGGALSGRTFLTGWPDREPVIPGSVPYGDVIVPYVMAATAAAALEHKARTGKGAHVDASMYEICVQQMAPAILAAQSGPAPERSGNKDAGRFHQDVYPSAGDDRWVAISLRDREEQDRLHDLIGGTDIAAWTAARTDQEAAETLQAAGFEAGALQDMEDLVEADKQLAARGALVVLEHARLGKFGHVRTPIGFSQDQVSPYRPPNLGEHNEEIATQTCGLSLVRLRELQDEGVFK